MSSSGDPENQTNLIINYLPQNMTDDEFKSMFIAIGPIKSCKIIRDHMTNYSYGFGFVDYYDPEHAARAIETLNGLPVQNKKLKVAYSRKGENVKGTNLYIKGLPPQYSEDDLYNAFSKYGNIVNCRVLIDPSSGQGRGVGFVLYSAKHEAVKAIQEMTGKVLEGSSRNLSVQFADEYTLKARPGGQQLPYSSPQGGSHGCNYHQYSPQGSGRGYAGNPRTHSYPSNNYNNYYSQHGCCAHNMYGGMSCHCGSGGGGGGGTAVNPRTNYNNYNSNYSNYTQPPAPSGGGSNQREYVLFVYNIGAHSDQVSLLQLFSSYGHIAKVHVAKDPTTGQSKGYGFVTMVDFQAAQAAIRALNGYKYMGRPLQVSFKS